jgi:hypothetical protein
MDSDIAGSPTANEDHADGTATALAAVIEADTAAATTDAASAEGILAAEMLVGVLDDEILGAAALAPTRFTAEEWKRRALYENDRRVHMEQELLRIRDDIDRVIRRAAILPRDSSH